MRKIKYKKIIVVAMVLIVAIVGVVSFMFNKPHKNIEDTKPSYVLSSGTLVNDFEMNEAESNKKYLDKVLEVKGEVSSVEIMENKAIITLLSDNTMGSVTCNFINTDLLKVKELKEGMPVSIKGICTGYLMDVVLVKCVIINKKK